MVPEELPQEKKNVNTSPSTCIEITEHLIVGAAVLPY